jgi:hypothetical protein
VFGARLFYFLTWYQSLGSEVQWTEFGTWIAVTCRGFCSEEEGEERVFVSWTKMTSCIRYEDRLEGISNYLQWKVRIASVLKENKLWTFVSTTVPVPSLDPIALDIHEVKEARAQRIILDGVRDHLNSTFG